MAEKKALLIVAEQAELCESNAAAAKLLKKAAVATQFTAGTILDGSIAASDIVEATTANVAELIEKGTAFTVLNLGNADAAALDAALEICLEATDRRTVIAVVTKGSIAFYGLGINAKAGKIARAVCAQDVLPTLAYIADLTLTDSCCGAIVYQALKNPNLKVEEINKLKEALVRMEGVIARDNREPWEKHDCA